MSKEDWTGETVTCIDPVETDMFAGDSYLVTVDYGRDVCVVIKGLDRFYVKSRFVQPNEVLG